jgi:hypothetical protein
MRRPANHQIGRDAVILHHIDYDIHRDIIS